jgi:hypothetical protein
MTSSFFAGGNKSLSFGPIGDTSQMGVWKGGVVIAKSEPMRAQGMQGELKTFKSGDPVEKIVITLSTWQGKTPAPQLDAEDDGVRDYHVEQGSPDMRAIQAALRDAKAPGMDIQVGSELYVVWTHEEPAKTAGFGNRRIKSARYVPPAADPNAFFGSQQGAPQQPAAPAANGFQAPPQQPGFQGVQPNLATVTPQQAAAMNEFNQHQAAAAQQANTNAVFGGQQQPPAQTGPPANPFLNGQAPQQPNPFGQAPGAPQPGQQFQAPPQQAAPVQPQQQYQAPPQPGGVPPFPG